MKYVRGVVCYFLISAPLICAAGSSSQNKLAEGMKGKIVLLRGMELGDKLSFDAQGAEIGTATQGSFAYSAVKIEKVHQSGTDLEIKSERIAMLFQSASKSPSLSDIRFVPLSEPVDIKIAINAAQPDGLDATIRKVFAFSPLDALSGKSPDAEKTALDSLGSTAPSGPPPPIVPAPKSPQRIYKAGSDVTAAPHVTRSVPPKYTAEASKKRLQGICILSMTIDVNGRPDHIRVVRSLDPGLDVEAITAASQYRFTPAIYHGEPVPVFINLEINFRIY